MQGRHFGVVRVFRSPPGVEVLSFDGASNAGFALSPLIHVVRDFANAFDPPSKKIFTGFSSFVSKW